jgi:hypothetical protein
MLALNNGEKSAQRKNPLEAVSEDFVLDTKSEKAWLDLFEPRHEHDPWLSLEEHLLEKNRRDANMERRWKYFGK